MRRIDQMQKRKEELHKQRELWAEYARLNKLIKMPLPKLRHTLGLTKTKDGKYEI